MPGEDDELWKVQTRPEVPVAAADEPATGKIRVRGRPLANPGGPISRSAAPIAALFLMGFAHVVPVLASGRVWARNDYGASVVPAFATLTGRTPFFGAPSWAPHVFGGAPLEVLAAMPRYPLNLFAYLLEPPQAMAVFVGLHLAIAAATAWFFIRRVAGTSRSAALFGAMVYAFGGALWLRGMHPDYLAVAAWMPAVLRCAWDLAAAGSAERRRRFAALLALFTGLTLSIGGGAPVVVLTAIAALVVTADGIGMRARAGVPRLRALRDAAPMVAAGVGCGVLLGTPGALPFLEVVLGGARGRLSVLESSAFAFFPPAWGRVLIPELGARWPWPMQVEPWAYAGVITLPLAALGLGDPRGRTLALWLLAAVIAAAGSLGPIHWILYYGMPGYALLRAPGRWLIFAGLAAGGLAARGLDRVLSGEDVRRAARVLGAVMAALAFAALVSRPADPLVRQGTWYLSAHAALAAMWLFGAGWRAPGEDPRSGPRSGRFVAGAATVLLAVDLTGVVLRTPVDEDPAALDPPAALAVAAGEAGPLRLFHDDSAGPRPLDNGNRWGYRNARGYSQAVPASFSTLLDLGRPPAVRFTGWPERLDPRLLRLLGVAVYVGAEGSAPPPGFATKPFVSKDGLAAWRSLEPPFVTSVVSEVIVAPTREIEATTAVAIDTATVAVVAEDVGLPPRVPGARTSRAGDARLERRPDGSMLARVTAEREALLVVGEGFHRRWRAWVDGKRAPIVRANSVWMGVRIPTGSHEVRFACGPAVRSWMWLLFAAGVAGTAWLGGLAAPPWLRTRGRT